MGQRNACATFPGMVAPRGALEPILTTGREQLIKDGTAVYLAQAAREQISPLSSDPSVTKPQPRAVEQTIYQEFPHIANIGKAFPVVVKQHQRGVWVIIVSQEHPTTTGFSIHIKWKICTRRGKWNTIISGDEVFTGANSQSLQYMGPKTRAHTHMAENCSSLPGEFCDRLSICHHGYAHKTKTLPGTRGDRAKTQTAFVCSARG